MGTNLDLHIIMGNESRFEPQFQINPDLSCLTEAQRGELIHISGVLVLDRSPLRSALLRRLATATFQAPVPKAKLAEIFRKKGEISLRSAENRFAVCLSFINNKMLGKTDAKICNRYPSGHYAAAYYPGSRTSRPVAEKVANAGRKKSNEATAIPTLPEVKDMRAKLNSILAELAAEGL